MLLRLMWFFAAAFLFFGVAMLLSEDPSRQKWLLGLTTLSLGCFAMSMASDGIARGQIRLQHSVIMRRSHPRLFWATAVFIFSAGAGVIVSAIWAMFFKVW